MILTRIRPIPADRTDYRRRALIVDVTRACVGFVPCAVGVVASLHAPLNPLRVSRVRQRHA